MKNLPKKIYLGRRNGDTELNLIDFEILLKRGMIIPKLEQNNGNDIEYVLSERQESNEHSDNNDRKALHIDDVSKRFCELSYDFWECGKHGDYVTGCLECKYFK